MKTIWAVMEAPLNLREIDAAWISRPAMEAHEPAGNASPT